MPVYVKQNRILHNKVLYNRIDNTVIPKHINSSTTYKLANKNPSTDRSVYSSQDPYYNGVGQFIRNPNCWLNGVSNISCFSPAQLSGATWYQRGGTLITRKHIVLARHYSISILPNGGTPMIFVDDNNNVVRRNLVGYQGDDGVSDIGIGVLDQEVPENIKIAKVLPPNTDGTMNFRKYFSGSYLGPLPEYDQFTANPLIYAVMLDQEEKASLRLLYQFYTHIENNSRNGKAYVPNYVDLAPNEYSNVNPSPTNYSGFFENVVAGDSGNPIFFIIDNELVILATWWTPTSGSFITWRYDFINQMIENLSPGEGYSLTPINIESVYNKYRHSYLQNNIINNIDDKILNKNPSTTKPIFSTLNHTTSSYVRNTSVWTGNVDLTGIGVWNSQGGGTRGFTLISPRHVLMATHYPVNPGSTLRFVTQNNTVITRTLSSRVDLPSMSLLYPDISVGVLDSDVPSTIKFLKLLPPNYTDKINIPDVDTGGNPSFNLRLPVFYTDQEEKALVFDWYGILSIPSENTFMKGFRLQQPISSNRLNFYETVIGGDSGSPICAIIQNELVLLSTFTSPFAGVWLTHHINDINSAMTSLGGGYQISTINLDIFDNI